MRVCSGASVAPDFATLWTITCMWTVACQVPLSLGFSRQKYWSGLPCLPQGTFLTQGLNPHLLHCRRILYPLSLLGSPWLQYAVSQNNYNNSIKDHWSQITITNIIVEKYEYCKDYQMWHRNIKWSNGKMGLIDLLNPELPQTFNLSKTLYLEVQ